MSRKYSGDGNEIVDKSVRTFNRKRKKTKSIYHHANKEFYRSRGWKSMRQFVYERERGCCQVCGKFVFGKQAQVHHIVPVAKNPLLKLEPKNLMLVCPKCHVKVENDNKPKKVFPSYFQK